MSDLALLWQTQNKWVITLQFQNFKHQIGLQKGICEAGGTAITQKPPIPSLAWAPGGDSANQCYFIAKQQNPSGKKQMKIIF